MEGGADGGGRVCWDLKPGKKGSEWVIYISRPYPTTIDLLPFFPFPIIRLLNQSRRPDHLPPSRPHLTTSSSQQHIITMSAAKEDAVHDAGYKQSSDLEYGVRHHNNGFNHTQEGGSSLATKEGVMMPAFGGAFQPGPYQPSFRKFANPAPLGLCAFALTTFVLSLINANARGVSTPNIVVGMAYAYGGLVQLLAGMWEMAVGSK